MLAEGACARVAHARLGVRAEPHARTRAAVQPPAYSRPHGCALHLFRHLPAPPVHAQEASTWRPLSRPPTRQALRPPAPRTASSDMTLRRRRRHRLNTVLLGLAAGQRRRCQVECLAQPRRAPACSHRQVSETVQGMAQSVSVCKHAQQRSQLYDHHIAMIAVCIDVKLTANSSRCELCSLPARPMTRPVRVAARAARRAACRGCGRG